MKKHTQELSSIVFVIYDFIFTILFFIYLPFYSFKKKINLTALKKKIFLDKFISKCIWIQAVSVGEVNLIETLVKRLYEIYDFRILISTTTLAGYKLAIEKYSSYAEVIFFPLDISIIVKRFLKRINPVLFISIETEIWPNLFFALKKKNVPIIIINGRVSTKAFKKYLLVKSFFKKILNICDYVGVQSDFYKERFIKLGCDKNRLSVTGNLKFETIKPDKNLLREVKEFYLPIIKNKNSFIILAGSTHFKEEGIIIDIYKEILRFNVSLIIAPRHLERLTSIERLILKNGFNPIRISNIKKEINNPIYLVDKIGKLLYFYSIADICFVGGSLINYGGHNILEPIYFLKPTIFGPYMGNFKDIVEVVLENKAGIMVRDNYELKDTIINLLEDKTLRDDLSNRCLKVFEGQKTVLEKNLEMINKCLG